MQVPNLFQDKRKFFWCKWLWCCKGLFLLLILLCTWCRPVPLVYNCILLLSDSGTASVQSSFSNDCWRFPLSDNRLYMPIFKLSLSELSIWAWWFFLFSGFQCNNFKCHVINKTFRLPYKTNHGTPGQVDFSLHLLISLKVPKSTRWEDSFFFPVLFSQLLCVRNVGKAFPMAVPLLHVYLVYMHRYIVQQFIIFTEHVETASLFLSETSLHTLFNTIVVILYKIYVIPRISG